MEESGLAGLHIKDFGRVFLCFEATRGKEISWVKLPVANSSTSYRRLMRTPAGHTAYSVFIGIVRLCSRGKTDGALTVKGKPMTVDDIEDETGIPAKFVMAGIDLLKTESVGWLVTDEQREKSVASTEPSRKSSVNPPDAFRIPLAGANSNSSSLSSSGSSDSGGGAGEPRIRAPMSSQWPQLTLTEIRAAYPVQAKGKATLLAIDGALCRIAALGVPDGPRWLKGRVEAFARAVAGQQRQYLPHPPKWFDDERYNDDDESWRKDSDTPAITFAEEKEGF